MKQLTLKEEMIQTVDGLVGEWDNQETAALLAKLQEFGYCGLSFDLEAAINHLVITMIERAFVVGYQCGQNPDRLIFKEDL